MPGHMSYPSLQLSAQACRIPGYDQLLPRSILYVYMVELDADFNKVRLICHLYISEDEIKQ